MRQHPSAVVSSNAQIGRDVTIGPFCVVEDDVSIGDGCILHGSVTVKSGTTLGPGNQLFEGVVVGGPPQHIHMPEHPGRVIVGAGNVLREHVTIHRALDAAGTTTIGDDNLLMSAVHVAHDCHLGNRLIVASNALLAGHVTVEDRANLSGAIGIHQFCRVGTLAMVGGHARVVKDVPPFVTIDGQSGLVVGLNQIGLRRAGYSVADITQLKAAYRVIYRSGLPWKEIIGQLGGFTEGPAARYQPFLATSTRGIVAERRLPPGATLRLHEADDEARVDQPRIKAG